MRHEPAALHTDLEGLRLLAVGRIPRCVQCPRYLALVSAHARNRDGHRALPPVPAHCHYQVCAPLVERLERVF